MSKKTLKTFTQRLEVARKDLMNKLVWFGHQGGPRLWPSVAEPADLREFASLCLKTATLYEESAKEQAETRRLERQEKLRRLK